MCVPWTIRRCFPAMAIFCTLSPKWTEAQTAPTLNPVAVRAALIPRINDGTFHGLATAWRDGDSLLTASAGTVVTGGAAVSATTRFELGDAAAVFTTALLAQLVVRGELSLDDPAQRFLPAAIRLPARNGRVITLGDLAYHRSGLTDPRQSPSGRSEVDQLVRALRETPLRSDVGARYRFSQLGIDLLGLALARHLRMPLEGAIRSRILSPLGITDVALSATRPIPARDAVGHRADGIASPWRARAGIRWRSSVLELARFAIAAGDTINGPLASTFALMMRTRSPGPDPMLPVALGWRVLPLDGRDIYWHDAQDPQGFSVYVAMDPNRRRAAAALGNTARPVDALAGQLLLGRVPVLASVAGSTPASKVRSRGRTRRPGQN